MKKPLRLCIPLNCKGADPGELRSAHYYLKHTQASALPREQRRGVSDVQGIIEAVWQYTQAAQWQEAYIIIEQENLFYNLYLWGGNILLLDLCQWFLNQAEWQLKPKQIVTIYRFLGNALTKLGKWQQALVYFQQALSIKREVGTRNEESVISQITLLPGQGYARKSREGRLRTIGNESDEHFN